MAKATFVIASVMLALYAFSGVSVSASAAATTAGTHARADAAFAAK